MDMPVELPMILILTHDKNNKIWQKENQR